MNINIVTLGGNLTRDPEVRNTPGGVPVADLGLAINDSYKNKAGELVKVTCFVDVQVWGKTAENCGQYLRKGSQIVVEGKLQLDEWEKDGQKRSKIRVRADRVHFVGARATSSGTPAQPTSASASSTHPPPDDDLAF